jgi:hypothetical protein
MRIATIAALFTAAALACTPVFAKGGGRANYGGGKHTSSHGGHYKGVSGGSSHKGGTYSSPRGGNDYGKHKK